MGLTTQGKNFILGTVLLLLGAMYYIFVRNCDAWLLTLSSRVLLPCGSLQASELINALPTLLHTVAMPLLTFGVVCQAHQLKLIVCASWGIINILLETLQKVNIEKIIYDASSVNDVIFLGNFSAFDIMAAMLGVIISIKLLDYMEKTGDQNRKV